MFRNVILVDVTVAKGSYRHEKLWLHFPSVLLIFGTKLLYTLPPLFQLHLLKRNLQIYMSIGHNIGTLLKSRKFPNLETFSSHYFLFKGVIAYNLKCVHTKIKLWFYISLKFALN